MIPSVQIATADDEPRITAVMTLSFSADPVARWTYPDPHDYFKNFPSIVRAFRSAFEHNTVYAVDDFRGAALWLPPNVQPQEDELAALFQQTMSESHQQEVFAMIEQMDRYHPDEPHWYLPLLGVDPTLHGNGYGSALMHHTLTACDRENAPAYLEASSSRNLALYQRYGFELLGTIQVGSSPTFFPMLRKPRSQDRE
ncbi:GNAT family N-acetyltransferase [Egbenema bharatensis]|uniref:GNAT family N-acetyltransferase n=1 Tax=Egbenema bharatensis TaxID=3463334 RepID=UPI003A8AE0CD